MAQCVGGRFGPTQFPNNQRRGLILIVNAQLIAHADTNSYNLVHFYSLYVAPRFMAFNSIILHVRVVLCLAGDFSDSALLHSSLCLPQAVSPNLFLPSYWPIIFLLTIRATHIYSVQKDYPTASVGIFCGTFCQVLGPEFDPQVL